MDQICLARTVQGMYVLKKDQFQHTHTVNITIMFDNKLDSTHYDYYYRRLPI